MGFQSRVVQSVSQTSTHILPRISELEANRLGSRYAGSEEIWKFYKGEAEKYGVYEHTKFEHKVVAAEWNESTGKWLVKAENLKTGEIVEDSAEVVINCTGALK